MGRATMASQVSASEFGWPASTHNGGNTATTTSLARSEPGSAAQAQHGGELECSAAQTNCGRGGCGDPGRFTEREYAEGAPQDTSVATTSRKRRRGIDDNQSIAHEKEEDKRVTPARPQKGRGMTTWASTLCSCVTRQTATRKQFGNAVVNHIASRHVDVWRQKASPTIGRTAPRKGKAQTGLGARNLVAALPVLDARSCPSNILAGDVRIARKRCRERRTAMRPWW